MQKYSTDILIIGGGASGLAAAIAAKQFCPKLSISVLERNTRVGKKILSTGNGRCNLGNTNLDTGAYFGSCKTLLPIIQKGTKSAKDFFRDMGLYCREETGGRLYPYANHASSVLDAIYIAAKQLDISLKCDCMVRNLTYTKGKMQVETSRENLTSHAVILTTGGFAAPGTGSDGNSFSWMNIQKHVNTPPKPALVPFYTSSKNLRMLKGIRLSAKVCAVSNDNRVLAEDTGEVQFTDRTISGICVMNLSAACVMEEPNKIILRLLPNLPASKIKSILWELYCVRANWKLEDYLTGILPKKAGMQILRDAGISQSFDSKVCQIDAQQVEHLYRTILHWEFLILRRGEWKEAQVTSGGISVTAIDKNLQSRTIPGLFFAGEILDIHGKCGGYNLNWAWQSGQYAGIQAANFVLQARKGNHVQL